MALLERVSLTVVRSRSTDAQCIARSSASLASCARVGDGGSSSDDAASVTLSAANCDLHDTWVTRQAGGDACVIMTDGV